METGSFAPPLIAGLLGLIVLTGYALTHFQHQIRRILQLLQQPLVISLKTIRIWMERYRFAVHQVLLLSMGAVALLICVWQKSWIMAYDPGSRPYDETLLQKLPLTVAALLTLFPTAMLVLRFTLPGLYKYLNYAYPDASPELDLNALPPAKKWIRAVVSLSVYLFIVFLGVLLFTGNL